MPTFSSKTVESVRQTRRMARWDPNSPSFVIFSAVVILITFAGLFCVSAESGLWVTQKGQLDLAPGLGWSVIIGLDGALAANALSLAVQRSRGQRAVLPKVIMGMSLALSTLLNVMRALSLHTASGPSTVAVLAVTCMTPVLILGAIESVLTVLVKPAENADTARAKQDLVDKGIVTYDGGKSRAVKDDMATIIRSLAAAEPELSRAAIARRTGASPTQVKAALDGQQKPARAAALVAPLDADGVPAVPEY
ncbi:hypothetical protein ACRAWC_01580 [Leifsonia sp. L25]|uniref:hypothetical protein n=1 Tax=Actinomycetes TaxID=1760 RepID=UPI003D68B429